MYQYLLIKEAKPVISVRILITHRALWDRWLRHGRWRGHQNNLLPQRTQSARR